MRMKTWMLVCLAAILSLGLLLGCGDDSDECVDLCVKTAKCLVGGDLGSHAKDACKEACKDMETEESSAYCCLKFSDCDQFMECYQSGGATCNGGTGDSGDEDDDEDEDKVAA